MMVLGSREMVELLSQGLAFCEVDMITGLITWASQPLETMFGYHLSGEMEGLTVEMLVPENLREVHSNLHRPSFAVNPQPRQMGRQSKLSGRKKDGTVFPVEVMLLPKAVNRIKVVVCVVMDMTNRQ